MAHDRERTAFEHFVQDFRERSTLLVDTYDTVRGVQNAVIVAEQMRRQGFELQGVRLDSGDLADLSLKARAILDLAVEEYFDLRQRNKNESRSTIGWRRRAYRCLRRRHRDGRERRRSSLDLAYKLNNTTAFPESILPRKLTLPGR